MESERMELQEGWNPESVLHTLFSVIVNYPGPDRSVRLDQIRQGKAIPRRYRNCRTGDFLKELEITKGRSTGVPRILRAMKKNGSPPPIFDFDEDHSNYLNPALTANLIEYTIPGKPQSRLQKYRLTAKGKALMGNR